MKNIVNIGVVGISGRGSSMLRELLNCEGVRVPQSAINTVTERSTAQR